MQVITVLGATGSIGVSALSVIAGHPDRFRVYALTGHTNLERLAEQIEIFQPQVVALADPAGLPALRERLGRWRPRLVAGPDGLAEVAAAPEVDTVVAAIVGAAGLEPTLAAVRAGKRVLLANKESLVMAGSLFMRAVADSAAQLLPVDSEHNAIFQCLPPEAAGQLAAAGVRKLWLTASGGPFRDTPIAHLAAVTPAQACAHPNWSMGQKISVDSATMMNKGLEYIEARWLFGAPLHAIEILIHPQSVVHSMVEYCDGSVLAQLGQPDMRTPIAHCLGYPARIAAPVRPLDFATLGALTFAAPDMTRFPCLALALAAAEQGGNHAIALNAANEVAVAAFLARQIGYLGIARIVEAVLIATSTGEPGSLAEVITADSVARRLAAEHITAQSAALSGS